jgi:hypothetical protein
MKAIIISLMIIILQEQGYDGKTYSYKAVTEKGDTGTVYSGFKLKLGDTIHLR